MKIYLCILSFISIMWANESNNATQMHNIESYMKLARENYPLYKNTQLLDKALALSLTQLNMHFIPHLRFSGKASYQSEVTTLPFTALNNFSFDYKPLNKDQYQFVLELAQPVLDMGHFAKKDSIKAQYATQKADVSISLYKIGQSVINQFFALALINEQISQNEIHIEELNKNLKNLNVLYRNGAIEKEALSKINIEILNAQKIAQELQSQKEVVINTLSLLTAYQVSDNPLLPDFEEQKEFLQSVQHYIQDLEIRTQKKLENAKNLPYIDLFVQGGYANPGLNFLKGAFSSYYIAGVRINWDFSNLYSKSQQNELIKNQSLRLNAQKEEFNLNNKITLNKHIKDTNNLLMQMKENDEIVALRESILRTQEVKLRNGMLSINDFITDINNLNLAKLQQNYTKIEFLMQIYNIKQILNVWHYDEAQ
ncbi:TolC family protein [Helicobacter japonicus]|uniref:TolC family protein n=1 Tax=Helicobacter japonicus TaxID=425400 RepID=UPI0025980121|nr:TolC family protein [Helicobacter japonicus]